MKKQSFSQIYQHCLDVIEKYQHQFDRWLPMLMVGMVAFILMWGVHIARQPITVSQQRELIRLSEHYLYPHSKSIAQDLLQQSDPIYRYQYFHLLRVMHDESKRLNIQEEMKWEKKQLD